MNFNEEDRDVLSRRGYEKGSEARDEYYGVVARVFFNGMLLCGEKSNAISLSLLFLFLSLYRFLVALSSIL